MLALCILSFNWVYSVFCLLFWFDWPAQYIDTDFIFSIHEGGGSGGDGGGGGGGDGGGLGWVGISLHDDDDDEPKHCVNITSLSPHPDLFSCCVSQM